MNFILGRVREPVQGQVCDWVQEHQARLQLAFDGARERLSAAAAQCKERHDQHVRDSSLISQLVYVRNLGLRGHNKIQDPWSLVVYTVLRAPPEGGAVYTVAPTTDLHKVEHLHRSMLKGLVAPASIYNLPSTALWGEVPLPQHNEVSSDEELWVDQVVTVQQVLPAIRETPPLAGALEGTPVGPAIGTKRPEAPSILQVEQAADSTSNRLRQTARIGASERSNPHRLPRAAGDCWSGNADV